MSDIVFLDCETLGLHPDAPIWEFAAVRRDASGDEVELQFFINHEAGAWLDEMPGEFLDDYGRRYDSLKSQAEGDAARLINMITKGAHVIGAVPSFDTERLAKLLLRNGIQPGWHYHLIDVENVVVGYLRGGGTLLLPPYESNTLSMAIGVDPDDFNRHTAMGDVRWVMAQWDAVMSRT